VSFVDPGAHGQSQRAPLILPINESLELGSSAIRDWRGEAWRRLMSGTLAPDNILQVLSLS